MERDILLFWEENRVFDKLRRQTANGPRWSFLDGPITANNPMGVHHAWGRSLKDMYQRYHAMNGHALRYQNGFDCQGLWVEVTVERAKGFLAQRLKIPEGQAYQRIRALARQQRRPMRDVARAVLDTQALLDPSADTPASGEGME